ncbi:MAG TPA: hypothetical protein VFO83_02460 [Aggregicoccus sp.]|nr:hypothetical protein [Aggregicoccus sp.]
MPPLFEDEAELVPLYQEPGTGDSRTLRLASPQLDDAQLEALVRYQQAFLAHAEPRRPAGPVPASLITEAHEAGLGASGLDVKAVERGSALLRAFAGRRWTLQRVRTRYGELQAEQTPRAAEQRARVEEELARLESLQELEQRHGPELISRLLAREAELVDLHARLGALLQG